MNTLKITIAAIVVTACLVWSVRLKHLESEERDQRRNEKRIQARRARNRFRK